MKKQMQYSFGQLREIPEDVEKTRTIQFIVSDGSKDRHNSIISPDGWDLRNYEKNPIVGYQHNVYSSYSKPDPDNVIGTATVTREGTQLIADIEFEPAEINPLAEKLFRKVIHGTIRATSVGFYPNKSHKGDEEKGEEKGVMYYDEAELLEISLVNLPSNPNAVKNAIPEDKIELIKYILTEALGDKFNETLTVKGIFNILSGVDEEITAAKYPIKSMCLTKYLKIIENECK